MWAGWVLRLTPPPPVVQSKLDQGALCLIVECITPGAKTHSGMVAPMVVDVPQLTQVTHAGLAVGDTTCHPLLRGLVCAQKMGLMTIY